MNLINQAESLIHRIAIESARTRNPDRLLRLALVRDSAFDRLERRRTKCGLCGLTFEPSDLTPNKYQGQLCAKCYLIYECW